MLGTKYEEQENKEGVIDINVTASQIINIEGGASSKAQSKQHSREVSVLNSKDLTANKSEKSKGINDDLKNDDEAVKSVTHESQVNQSPEKDDDNEKQVDVEQEKPSTPVEIPAKEIDAPKIPPINP